MAKITDPDLLNVGTELSIDLSAKTFTLNVAGNLVAKDGCTAQALYSKFVELWTTSTYNKYPFPGYVVGDPRAGMFIWGFDGSEYSGWKPANDTTRQRLRDAGWAEYSSGGVLNRVYVGVISLGDVNSGAQLYYQRASGGSALSTTFTDELNEALQVYGDASNGNFDNRSYFRLFCREYGYKYDLAQLSDIGETVTGPWKIGLPLSNEADLKIQANDATVAANSPYTGITVTYLAGTGFAAWQTGSSYVSDVVVSNGGRWYICATPHTAGTFATDLAAGKWVSYTGERLIAGAYRPYTKIIAGNGAVAEDIYTKAQYLLRQDSDIDSGAGTVNGKTADALLSFTGDTLTTALGVYIDDYDPNDINRLVFTDQNGVERTEPFTAAGTLTFDSFLTSGGTGYYRMWFKTLPSTSDDYGESGAVTVNDASDTPIAGTITGSSIAFTFAYDTNTQGGRTAGTDATVVVVFGNPSSAKPTTIEYTITRATGQVISCTSEQDRGYAT